jgi:hypothetical protein
MMNMGNWTTFGTALILALAAPGASGRPELSSRARR